MNKKLKFSLKLIFGLGLLLYLILDNNANFGTIFELLKRVSPWMLLLAFSLHITGILIKSARWRVLLNRNDAHFPMTSLIKFYLVSIFFNHFLPSRFGGDIVRISDTKSMKDGTSASIAIVFVERISGIFMLLLFALIAATISTEYVNKIPVVWGAIVLGLAGIVVGITTIILLPARFFKKFNPRIGILKKLLEKVEIFHSVIKNRYLDRGIITKILLWGALLQLNVVVHYFLLGQALSLKIPFLDYFIIISILFVILSIPSSINGIGVREYVLLQFFLPYGYKMETAIAFSLIDMFFNLLLGLAGGFIYITRKKDDSREVSSALPDKGNSV